MPEEGRTLFCVAAEHVIDDDVGLERRNQDKAVEDQERGNAELQKRLEFQRQEEAVEERLEVPQDGAAYAFDVIL